MQEWHAFMAELLRRRDFARGVAVDFDQVRSAADAASELAKGSNRDAFLPASSSAR